MSYKYILPALGLCALAQFASADPVLPPADPHATPAPTFSPPPVTHSSSSNNNAAVARARAAEALKFRTNVAARSIADREIWAATDSNKYRNTDRAIERANDPNRPALTAPAHAGTTMGYDNSKEYKGVTPPAEPECIWFCYPSVFAEYNYIDSNDERDLGSDGITHSFQIGGDFSTIGGLLIGGIYSYSSQDLESDGLNSDSDIASHFFSLYASKNFANWINVGVVGGYGNTESETHLSNPSVNIGDESDTWTVTPFLGVAHSWGAFSASLSGSYMWSYSDSDSERFMTDLTLGYAITDHFSLAGCAKYNNVTDSPPSFLSEDDEWVTFGGKASYRVCESFGVYAGYEYDAFNTNYENHSFRGGLTLSF